MKRTIAIFLAAILAMPLSLAQSERRSVRSGNHDFRKEKYQEAEIDYKKALVADSLSNAAGYNLGNTYYRMEDYENAVKSYESVSDSLAKDSANGASMYHNLGNALLKQKNYQGAIEAYKNALRRNPSDMDTKTNLSYAKKMLENQQNQDQNQQDRNQNQQDQQDQKNQDQNQNQDQQNRDQKDQKDQKNQDQRDRQPQQQQGQQPKISQKDAQQMLQAIQDKEDDTQEKVKKEKALMMRSRQKDKNW